MPANQDPTKASLGLNLGLNPNQRQRYRQNHPGQGTLDPNRGPTGVPGLGGTPPANQPPKAKPPAGGPGATPAAPPPPAGGNPNSPLYAFDPRNPNRIDPGGATAGTFLKGGGLGPGVPVNAYNAWQATQFGSGNPFGMRGNYQDPNNPIFAAANRALQQALAGIRGRYGNAGLGNSSREALAEGDAAANFGAQIAQTGEQAYQQDANRGLNAYNAGTGSNLAQNAQLGDIGKMLNSIGLNEQNMPMLGALMQLFQTFFQSSGTGTTDSKTGSGTGAPFSSWS